MSDASTRFSPRHQERLEPWLEVFPEIADRSPDPLAAVGDHLRRVDDIPDGLATWLTVEPDSGRVRPPGDPLDVSGIAETRLPFGRYLQTQVDDLVADALDALSGVPWLAPDGPWRQQVALLAGDLSAAVHLRSMLRLLAQRRELGLLAGDNSADRYTAFCDWLESADGAHAMHSAWPDLRARARAMTRMTMTHLVADLTASAQAWPHIAERLGHDASARLCDLRFAGDAHGGGRRVAVLQTDDGSRVVLKPRGVAMERAYAGFSAWLGRRVGLTLPQPAVVSGEEVGWAAYVGSGSGIPAEAHRDYFAMLGVHLAALVLVNGTDVHYENLLADDQGRPVVIDAEAMLTPSLRSSATPPLRGVAETGLVSVRPAGGDLDMGALGYRAGALSPFREWQLTNLGRDDLRLQMRRVRVDAASPMPQQAGLSTATAGEMRAVFAQTMRWAMGHRDQLTAEIERRFDDQTPVRYIHRPTMAYAMVMRLATHPRFARDRDRQRALSRLAVMSPQTGEDILSSEIQQMMSGDIPSFQVSAGGRLVSDGNSRRPVTRLSATPKEQVLAGIGGFTQADLDRELSVLDETLGEWVMGRQRHE